MNDIITVIIIISVIASVINNILQQRNREKQRQQGQPQPVHRSQTSRPLNSSATSTTISRTGQKEQEVEKEKEDWQKKLARKIQEIQKQLEIPAEEFPPFPRPKTAPVEEMAVQPVPAAGESTSLETESPLIPVKSLTSLTGLHETETQMDANFLLKNLNLGTPDRLREAIILSEILGPPKSLRRSGRRPGMKR